LEGVGGGHQERTKKYMKKRKITSENIFDELIGKKVSLLIDHFKPFSRIKETYVGIPFERKDRFLKVYIRAPENKLDAIFVREDQIISVWIYKD
jgi:hypothetical protein